MSAPTDRPPPREAGPELLALARWEEFVAWLIDHCAKWPKSARFTLTQRVENHALDVVEQLVVARYDPRGRLERLRGVNLTLERMRFLCRLAAGARVMPKAGFETALRQMDEVGRMLHGWRTTLAARKGGAPETPLTAPDAATPKAAP